MYNTIHKVKHGNSNGYFLYVQRYVQQNACSSEEISARNCKHQYSDIWLYMYHLVHVHAFLPKSTIQSLLKKNVVNEKTNSIVIPGRSDPVNPELPWHSIPVYGQRYLKVGHCPWGQRSFYDLILTTGNVQCTL